METWSLRDAALLIGCSPSTLLAHIRSGRLAARRSGGGGRLELRVAPADLSQAGLLPPDRQGRGPGAGRGALSLRVPVTGLAAPPGGDLVPGILYRELLMKHEHLLVQYGMLRGGGAGLIARRDASGASRADLDEARRSLRDAEEAHRRQIGELQVEVRRAELRLQERDEEVEALRARLRTLELVARNATTTETVERRFLEAVEDRGRDDPEQDLARGPSRRTRATDH